MHYTNIFGYMHRRMSILCCRLCASFRDRYFHQALKSLWFSALQLKRSFNFLLWQHLLTICCPKTIGTWLMFHIQKTARMCKYNMSNSTSEKYNLIMTAIERWRWWLIKIRIDIIKLNNCCHILIQIQIKISLLTEGLESLFGNDKSTGCDFFNQSISFPRIGRVKSFTFVFDFHFPGTPSVSFTMVYCYAFGCTHRTGGPQTCSFFYISC
jgi:hypothetical protein